MLIVTLLYKQAINNSAVYTANAAAPRFSVSSELFRPGQCGHFFRGLMHIGAIPQTVRNFNFKQATNVIGNPLKFDLPSSFLKTVKWLCDSYHSASSRKRHLLNKLTHLCQKSLVCSFISLGCLRIKTNACGGTLLSLLLSRNGDVNLS